MKNLANLIFETKKPGKEYRELSKWLEKYEKELGEKLFGEIYDIFAELAHIAVCDAVKLTIKLLHKKPSRLLR